MLVLTTDQIVQDYLHNRCLNKNTIRKNHNNKGRSKYGYHEPNKRMGERIS